MSVQRAVIYHKDNSPCFDCNERNAECHSGCGRYKAYKEKIEKTKADLMEKFKGKRIIDDYYFDKHSDIELCELKGKRRGRIK